METETQAQALLYWLTLDFHVGRPLRNGEAVDFYVGQPEPEAIDADGYETTEYQLDLFYTEPAYAGSFDHVTLASRPDWVQRSGTGKPGSIEEC